MDAILYMAYDINVEIDYSISDHTTAGVNEALDNISTEEYGSSQVSSLSWDPRIQLEAERVSQIIRDDDISSKNSFLDKDMNDQATQTSIQDEDESLEEMKIISNQNDNNVIEDEDMINPINSSDGNTITDQVDGLNNNNLSQVSCTRSGLVYK